MVIEYLMAMSLELYAQFKSEMIVKFEKLHPHKFLGGSNPYEAKHSKWKEKQIIGGK
ncbi:hypothetical protein CsSME_00027296 [Camellia sinensis var. sinensis]